MDKINKQEAVNTLRRREIYNLSVIGFINENEIGKIFRAGNSILAQGEEDERWIYSYAENDGEFTSLLNQLGEQDKYFGALDEAQVKVLHERGEVDWMLNAYQFHFPIEAGLPDNKIETRPLTENDSEYMLSQSNYKSMLTVKYLNERIRKSISAGIEINGQLVAWGLTHDDGSLGTMHVLEDYRKKGYAREVSYSLIRKCREAGKIPFLQCEKKNIPAQNLVESIGYVKDRNVSWLKLK